MSPFPSMKPQPYKFKLSKAVHKFEWDGRTYFWKRSPLCPHKPLVYFVMHLCARVLKISTGSWSLPGLRSRETEKLTQYSASGLNIPRVVTTYKNAWFIMLGEGDCLEKSIVDRSDEEKIIMLCRCADDLLKWHSLGHHHGASQVRNLILTDSQDIVRIDFEEELELVFLPDALKVIDLFLMAGSLNQLFLDREQRQKVMALIMLHYLRNSSDMNLNSIIFRLFLWFQRASYLLRMYPGKLGTDAIRILDLEKCLQIVTKEVYAKSQS
ncbi:MAG: hypothetical protein H3C47_10715 [Candidatus Cloacimonetes bacterium]|nr:hypothetical protein [Candidatus Cloacimonadota bacterium]